MGENSRTSTQAIVTVAVFTAVTVVLSQIAIPMPTNVPLTMQTFAISLCGYTLGKKKGAASVFVYLALGAIGLPVFSNFGGGFSSFVGPSGGFLYGFLILAFACGLFVDRENKAVPIVFGIIALAICHLFGVLQFAFVTNTDMKTAFLMASAPYIIKDIISIVLAYFISLTIRKQLKKVGVSL